MDTWHIIVWKMLFCSNLFILTTSVCSAIFILFQVEINRYITWPGQACAYKIGEIKIKELRQKAQNALGSLFRLSEFHSVLLGCMGPVKILEECVNNYIEQTNLVMEKGDEEMEEKEASASKEKEGESTDQSNGDVDSQVNALDTPSAGAMAVLPGVVVVLAVCVLHAPFL